MDGTKECRCIAKTPTKVGVFAWYSFRMSKADEMNQLKVDIKQWEPKTPEADKEFFEEIVPQLQIVKGRYAREKYSHLPEAAIQDSLDYLANRLHALKPGDVVPFARLGNHIVGFILVRWDEQEKRTQIEQFYVDPERRRGGIGTRLLERATQHARQTRPGESVGIFLTTGEENEGAQRLYGRFDFRLSATPAPTPGEVRLELDFGTEQKSVDV